MRAVQRKGKRRQIGKDAKGRYLIYSEATDPQPDITIVLSPAQAERIVSMLLVFCERNMGCTLSLSLGHLTATQTGVGAITSGGAKSQPTSP